MVYSFIMGWWCSRLLRLCLCVGLLLLVVWLSVVLPVIVVCVTFRLLFVLVNCDAWLIRFVLFVGVALLVGLLYGAVV